MSEPRLTNHDMYLKAMEAYRGHILTTHEIGEITQNIFPIFNLGSNLPNDHSDVGNNRDCWCARTDNRLFDRIDTGKYKVFYNATLADDIKEIDNSSESETTKKELIDARIGQGKFRSKLIEYWKCCAVTNVSLLSILKASHIKPWAVSTNQERLDKFNGLLLSPNLDALFDQGYISFNDDGEIMVSPLIANNTDALGINPDMKISKLCQQHFPFLAFHRNEVFQNA